MEHSGLASLSSARQHLIASWPDVLKPWSVPKAAARIHALLLSADATLTAEEITNVLGLSNGSGSTMLRLLSEIGMVERLRITGSRKHQYQAVKDPAAVFIALAEIRRRHAFKAMDMLGPTLTSIADKEDLPWLQTVGQLHTLSRMLEQWLTLRSERDPEWTVRHIQSGIQQN